MAHTSVTDVGTVDCLGLVTVPPSSRLALSPRLMQHVDLLAAGATKNRAVDPVDVLELATRSGLPSLAEDERLLAASLVERIAAGDVVDRERLATALGGVQVAALRMGPRCAAVNAFSRADEDLTRDLEAAPLERPEGGYARRWIGMSITDAATDVWQACRGYWRAATKIQYLVPLRFCFAPYVFKTTEWRRMPGSGRIWAAKGSLINAAAGTATPVLGPRGRSHAHWLGVPVPATEQDLTVAGLIEGQLIGLGPKSSNPVIGLSG